MIINVCNTLQHLKVKAFIDTYDWKDIKYPSGKDDWITFKNKHPTITLYVLYAIKCERIYQAYILIHNLKLKKPTFLMISNGEGIIKRRNIS